MAIHFIYVLAAWLRLKKPCLAAELKEFLEEEYCVIKIEIVNDLNTKANIGKEFSLQLQLSFNELQMQDNEPTEDAVSEIDQELRAFLKSKYKLEYLELLDDAPTSYLLAVEEDPG